MKKIQTEIQTILNKLSKRQLQKICKRMGIKCPKRKRVIVNKLLQPLGAKYKIVNLLSKITLDPQVPDYSDEYTKVLDRKIKILASEIDTLKNKINTFDREKRAEKRTELTKKRTEKRTEQKKLCIIEAIRQYLELYKRKINKLFDDSRDPKSNRTAIKTRVNEYITGFRKKKYEYSDVKTSSSAIIIEETNKISSEINKIINNVGINPNVKKQLENLGIDYTKKGKKITPVIIVTKCNHYDT